MCCLVCRDALKLSKHRCDWFGERTVEASRAIDVYEALICASIRKLQVACTQVFKLSRELFE